MLIIPATQEVKVGGLQSQTGPGKSARLYLKNKLKAKVVGMWDKWWGL
jgi:hypothetical protein